MKVDKYYHMWGDKGCMHYDEIEPCDDAISREDAIHCLIYQGSAEQKIRELPSVHPNSKGNCKDCKYFELDKMGKVDGMPIITAHEVCMRWGNGCKTDRNGYCYLFEKRGAE